MGADNITKSKILVIDDDLSVRESIRRYLEDSNFDVIDAENGEEGLNRLEETKPDLAMVDLKMPKLDGLQVLRNIQDQRKDIPVIVVSGAGEIKDVVAALRLGAWDYLMKPIDNMNMLVDSVNNTLKKFNLRQEIKREKDTLKVLVEEKNMALDRERKEKEVAKEKMLKLSSAVEQSPASTIICNASGEVEYVNKRFSEITGYEKEEILGKNIMIKKPEHVPEEQHKEMWDFAQKGKEWKGELCYKKRSGEIYWELVHLSPIMNLSGEIVNYLIVQEDLTEKKEFEDKLEYQANFDRLTDLPNRLLALDRLKQSLIMAKRKKHLVAVMFVDLDQFKNVNDTLGHRAGDKLICEASRRLLSSVRMSDTVARLGGDEFLIILPDLSGIMQAELVARKILNAFQVPFLIEGQELFVTSSIGITVYPNDGIEPDTLMKNADSALFRAKESLRNTYQFFTAHMNEESLRRVGVEAKLRHALENKELFLNYQPLVNISTGQMYGAEALVRWFNPDLGTVYPDQFIGLAEETGLIIPIGEWVLRTAVEQTKKWQKILKAPLRIAVNISARQFKGPNIVNTIKNILDESGLPPDMLELEITEGLVLEDNAELLTLINKIRNMGVRLSIDDFGIGYSALSYLKKFSFNTLKIDRSFVKDIMLDESAAALAEAIISMAHSLKLDVVAEGIETKEQLNFLKLKGCDFAQGYYLSHPLLADELYAFARENIL